ncbi:SpoIIE family protein phosphatase [Vibrio maerlii]|uniref:SpoIIE family protein phosphatase n=1 Tax=Vibrio maerlii TaxID=2231648 RepID=UPI000E3CE5AC|nr:SpoIIE family protein phosphatase [Vibrio maerlii]
MTFSRYAIKNRAFWNESVSGDTVVYQERDSQALMAVIDGAGHGIDAHNLSSKMGDFLNDSQDWSNPSQLIEQLHQIFSPSIGAAVGIAVVDNIQRTITFAGVGNISAYLLGFNDQSLTSTDGSVGYNMRKISVSTTDLSAGDIVLLHSDGIQSRFYTQYDPDCKKQSANEILDYVFKNFEKQHDDASCIVYRV